MVEKKLAGINDSVMAIEELDFPVFAGGGGGVHLYKTYHNDKPWNWTGWVPLQKRWLCQGTFFSNRFVLK